MTPLFIHPIATPEATTIHELWLSILQTALWPIAIIVVSIIVYQLLSHGFVKRIKFGNKVSLDGGGYSGQDRRVNRCSEVDSRAIHLTQMVSRRRGEVQNSSWALQKAYADDMEDEFFMLSAFKGCDPWHLEACWNRFNRILYNAADQNHILEHVHDGRVSNNYLFEKMAIMQHRYEALLNRTGCKLPSYEEVEKEVQDLMTKALAEFADISAKEEAKLLSFVEDIKNALDDDDMKVVLDDLVSRNKE